MTKDEENDNIEHDRDEIVHDENHLKEEQLVDSNCTTNPVRSSQSHNGIWLLCMNSYAAVVVFTHHLITYESIISIVLSVGLTISLYYCTTDNKSERFNGQALNWVLLSFAVITPIAASINMAFTRRETALRSIGIIRATLLEMYIAHAIWDWGDHGKQQAALAATAAAAATAGVTNNDTTLSPDPISHHAGQVYDTMMILQRNLSLFLTSPSSSRARHRTTRYGRKEAIQIEELASTYYEQVVSAMVRLAQLCETLKLLGLPGNEAARLRQWEHTVLSEVEQLRNIKRYRTPQGLRSFGRIFSVFAPPFYAPYYTDLARQLNSLGMGIAFSIITAVALTALFETVASLEDPFVEENFLDGVNVKDELVTTFERSLSGRRRQLFDE